MAPRSHSQPGPDPVSSPLAPPDPVSSVCLGRGPQWEPRCRGWQQSEGHCWSLPRGDECWVGQNALAQGQGRRSQLPSCGPQGLPRAAVLLTVLLGQGLGWDSCSSGSQGPASCWAATHPGGAPGPHYRSVSSCERHGSHPHELGSCTTWLIDHVSLESAGTLEEMQHLEILMAPFAVPVCSWSLLPALFTLQAGPRAPGHQGISRELKGFRAAGTVPSPHPSLSACSTPSTFLQLINLLF